MGDRISFYCYNTLTRINNIMKLTDISPKALFEAVQQESAGTGFLTEDLVNIVDAEQGEWSTPVSGQQLLAEMDTWLNK